MIIFTDLDASLLNHDDYSFEDAKPALSIIKNLNIPLIITTSKTRKEIEILQKELQIYDPFISENGGGIFFQKGYRGFYITNCKSVDNYCLIQLGKAYSQIVDFEKRVMKEILLKGFYFMSLEEIAELTGLTTQQAKLAKEREFTEPFILYEKDKYALLEKKADKEDIKITKGGRFFHFIGKNQDKGKAVKLVKDIFEKNTGKKFLSVGLGDSKNDIPMLEVVDIPILIRKPDGSYENFEKEGLIKSRYSGSRGWNEAMFKVFNHVGISSPE
ncbi:MAG: HAD-IIB family hydrolase [Aquificae bacterium]|nr:HAD-IIB family hydrolase [Aquificota bacterium]